MRAVLQDRYGPPAEVLRFGEAPKPVPGPGEVLVKVRAASVHPDIWHVVTGRPYILRLMGSGFRRPKQPIPGIDLSGTVEALGPGATSFAVGDEVFGESHGGFQWLNGGAYAEYAAVPEASLERKPGRTPFEVAACIPASGIIALMNLDFAKPLRAGSHVLINGAAGGVGSIALQAAKSMGATVTAVERSGRLDLAESFGADHVIDTDKEDFTRGAVRYDLIYDVASNLSLSDCVRVLKPGGQYLMIGHDHFGRSTGPVLGSVPRALGHMVLSLVNPILPRGTFKIPPKSFFLKRLRELLEQGALAAKVGKAYPLADAALALRDLEDGRIAGRLILVP
jgi:NADPH:quinone reductase-like Zn-dependent oxidoreductase